MDLAAAFPTGVSPKSRDAGVTASCPVAGGCGPGGVGEVPAVPPQPATKTATSDAVRTRIFLRKFDLPIGQRSLRGTRPLPPPDRLVGKYSRPTDHRLAYSKGSRLPSACTGTMVACHFSPC